MKPKRNFASDNNAGIHAAVLKALESANAGHAVGYGDDAHTAAALKQFEKMFGAGIETFLVCSGTAANVLGLSAMARQHHAILCSDVAHALLDECNAVERFVGCSLSPLPAPDGKLTVDAIRSRMHHIGDEHRAQPRVVSLTQATELGTVYQPAEVRAISKFAHRNGMLVHMDGARIANAAAALGASPREFTRDAGVDVLSFGGTKNGLMLGDAVVFFDKKLAADFKYTRKQGMQLVSKMRFVAAQFEALLSGNLWLESASRANAMAKLLAAELEKIPQVKITQKVETNVVFAILPKKSIPAIQKEYFFYVWDERTGESRLMTAFDTTEQDVRGLAKAVRSAVK